ncbi:hypothetical protein E2320_005032, partial [Naja naja]
MSSRRNRSASEHDSDDDSYEVLDLTEYARRHHWWNRIASHSGYIQVDWKRVEKDVNKAKKQLKKRANKAAPEINTLIEESTEFLKQNIVVSAKFIMYHHHHHHQNSYMQKAIREAQKKILKE